MQSNTNLSGSVLQQLKDKSDKIEQLEIDLDHFKNQNHPWHKRWLHTLRDKLSYFIPGILYVGGEAGLIYAAIVLHAKKLELEAAFQHNVIDPIKNTCPGYIMQLTTYSSGYTTHDEKLGCILPDGDQQIGRCNSLCTELWNAPKEIDGGKYSCALVFSIVWLPVIGIVTCYFLYDRMKPKPLANPELPIEWNEAFNDMHDLHQSERKESRKLDEASTLKIILATTKKSLADKISMMERNKSLSSDGVVIEMDEKKSRSNNRMYRVISKEELSLSQQITSENTPPASPKK